MSKLPYMWKSEDNFQESIVSSLLLLLGIKLKSSDFAASGL